MLGKEIKKKKLKYLYGKVHKFSNTTRAGKNQKEKSEKETGRNRVKETGHSGGHRLRQTICSTAKVKCK